MKEKWFFFIYSLPSLRHDQGRKFFLHLGITITTLWSREKKVFFSFIYYDYYAMTKKEKSFFHLATMFTNEERKMLFFIYSVWSVCHDEKWKFFFIELLRSLRYDQERKKVFFHLPTTITTPGSREKKVFFI